MGGEGIDAADIGGVDYGLLADAEQVLLPMLEFGPSVRRAAELNEPSIITGLMIEIAGEIHSYLREHYVVGEAPAIQNARLVLVDAARRLLTTGLGLLGIAAPERM